MEVARVRLRVRAHASFSVACERVCACMRACECAGACVSVCASLCESERRTLDALWSESDRSGSKCNFFRRHSGPTKTILGK